MVRRGDVRDKFLGMPLHADDPPAVACRALNPLDDPVRRACGHPEPIGDLIDRLVMH
jgi:hypothetical protein